MPIKNVALSGKTSSKKSASAAPVHFSIELADLNAHLFRITLTIAEPAITQHVSLPVWIPGSYLVREFAKNLQNLQARQGGKTMLEPVQSDKSSWQIDCNPDKPLVISYLVFARDNSVRTAWLDADRGFFNGTSLCLRVEGQEDVTHTLELKAHAKKPNWQVATGAAAVGVSTSGFGTYTFANYDALVDCPFELGTFWSGEFKVRGVTHRLVVAGAASTFDGARLLADTRKICEAEMAFWHGSASKPLQKPPFKSYVFMLNAVDDGYGGLEHGNSTALICKRQDLPRLDAPKTSAHSVGYTTLLGLISHEYFHTWNVKRLRPRDFADYDYTQENYTELLWFFEGFTSYYDDLLLRRAGLLDDAQYLGLLCKTANQVLQTPGRAVQSVAQASFDAWVKYYRPEPNTANTTVSYYTKGALVALCFDLTLRREGKCTLDDVMRGLWARCKAGPMSERDFAAQLQELGGRSFAKEIAAWVHGTKELPVHELLTAQGVTVFNDPAQLQQRLGLRVTEDKGIHISVVLHGGVAQAAGFAPGDEWLGIQWGTGRSAQSWRLHKLDDLTLYVGDGKLVTGLTAVIARDKRLIQLPLTLDVPPAAASTWRLGVQDAKRVAAWLSAA
ncbi:MAG: peptidase M61 [Burkholderiaceae bacterium]|nr:peptidase M61 [Burkholderiaceae bacterium]